VQGVDIAEDKRQGPLHVTGKPPFFTLSSRVMVGDGGAGGRGVVEGPAAPRLGMEEKVEGGDGWRRPVRWEGAAVTDRGAEDGRRPVCVKG
jgi:hypothetical protein